MNTAVQKILCNALRIDAAGKFIALLIIDVNIDGDCGGSGAKAAGRTRFIDVSTGSN